MLEPFDHPGMLVVYHETDGNLNLQVAKHDHSVFCLVAGLDSRTLYPWRLKDIKVALKETYTVYFNNEAKSVRVCNCTVSEKVAFIDDNPTVSGLLSCSSCFLPRRSKYST
ncbi:hypothetical protein Peur_041367 [Populus x canadensis]